MDRAELQALLAEGLSLAEIGRRHDLHESTVGYWVKKHGLKAARREKHAARGALRREHLETLVEQGKTIAEIAEAVDRSHATVRHWLCEYGLRTQRAQNGSEVISRRRRVVEELLVREAGGACRVCGYDRCARALRFHRRDPAHERLDLSRRGAPRSLEQVRAEARKCILLCGNCHAELEEGLIDLGL
jgi:transposase